MTFAQLRYLIRSDLHRYHGRTSAGLLLREIVLGTGFTYSFWLRVGSWLSARSRVWRPGLWLARLILRHYRFKMGIDIPYSTAIGPGLYIGHFGGIHINSRARIGRNCNLSQEVSIGISNRGGGRGVPTIGDNVYIGPGAKIFGHVTIGDHAAIGANCVVTHDVPESGVVVGVPGRVISLEGSAGYINRTDYDHPRERAAPGSRVDA